MKIEEIVPELYKEYGVYVNSSKMLPSMIDGLLPVQRRILLTLHLVGKSQFVKTAKITGENMARFHPHSEATGTVAWCIHNGFALGHGQWGTDIGVEEVTYAAPRYTSVKANPVVEELAFKYVNYVPWEADELDPEPKTLPTMLPFCLMAKEGLSTIAFGFKCDIPCYSPKDLVKRLLFLKGKGKKEIIKPYVKGCEVTSSNEDLESILTTGLGKIEVVGKYHVDKKNNKIYIQGWNPRSKFQNVFDRIKKLAGEDNIVYIDESTQAVGTKVCLEVSKQRNVPELFQALEDAVKTVLTSNLTYSSYVYDTENEKIGLSSVDNMLLRCYEHFKKTLEVHHKDEIKSIQDKIKEIDVIKKIKPHISSCNKKTLEEAVAFLVDKTKLETELIKSVLDKYKIAKLLSFEEDATSYQQEITALQEELKDIDATALNIYKTLAKEK